MKWDICTLSKGLQSDWLKSYRANVAQVVDCENEMGGICSTNDRHEKFITKIYSRNLKERDHFEDLTADQRILLKRAKK